MSDLVVRPSYVLTESEVLTVQKLNLMATPVVELALQDPVNDQNFFRNGNFYSSFWVKPLGMTCPAGVGTSNANYWSCFPATVATYANLTASFVQPDIFATPTSLTASFVQPAVNATVTIAVATTSWMLPTQTPPQSINIAGGGNYTVSSVTDSTHAVVKNLGTGSPATPGATVPTAGNVAPNSSVPITVGATAWMSPTQAIYIVGGGDYTVLSVTDSTHAVVTNLGHTGNAAVGVTVPSGGGASPSAAAVTSLRSNTVPDTKSLFSAQLKGAASVGVVEYGQQINGDLSATLRRNCTFSGYVYNSTGLTLSPKLNIYTCNTFNNFAVLTLQTTVDLQTAANALWTYCSATVDLSLLSNVTNGLFITVMLPAGALASASNSVFFSRLKFQIGELATEFTDDVGLFIQTPSIDSTMLQDGCIARPTLFLPKVVPTGAYQAKSVNNGDVNDGAIDGRTLATGAVATNLGYTPVNKAGDAGVGSISHTVDSVSGTPPNWAQGVNISTTSANAANDGYIPAISFLRPGVTGRMIGLSTTNRFRTVDNGGGIGYLLDTVTGVDTNSYQNGSITYAKLAQALINLICPIGIVAPFAGINIPNGWFVCDGTAVSRTTYSALFAQLGTYWGVGDNINTFNLPNLVNRAPIGFGAGALAVFGSVGGEINHTLSSNEMPAHSHTISDPAHAHTMLGHQHGYVNPLGASIGTAAGGQTTYQPGGVTNANATVSIMGAAVTGITGTNNTGGNGAHNNMPPYAVLYYIIKAV